MKTTAIIGRLAAWASSGIILSACLQKQGEGAAGDKGGKPGGPKIALLLPASKTARCESKDRPFSEAKVKALCPDCQVPASNANQDGSQQQAHAAAALSNGARVLVLVAVDSASAARSGRMRLSAACRGAREGVTWRAWAARPRAAPSQRAAAR